MKKLRNICVWGGVSLLILALVASLCLAILPHRLTNEYENTDGVTHAATEVINGHEYAVLDVYADTNSDTIRSFVINNQYAKIVLQSDWAYGDRLVINTYSADDDNALIFDLHGHTFSVPQDKTLSFYLIRHLEIWDSSDAGTGQINCNYALVRGNNLTDVIIRGGTVNASASSAFHMEMVNPGNQGTIMMTGGRINGQIKFSIFYNDQIGKLTMLGGSIEGMFMTDYSSNKDCSSQQIAVDVAPYLKGTDNGNGLSAVQPYDAYAVSTTPYATGLYNYAYGLAWEINATELSNQDIPTDKTYYLWARDGSERYRYLNLRYTDGAWQ